MDEGCAGVELGRKSTQRSPEMDIEHDIQAKGLTAPRVTP